VNYARTLPIVAVVEEHGVPRIVAVASLSFHPDQPAFRHKAGFGITVHDDYQNRNADDVCGVLESRLVR
jgi:hypothetical protein